MRKKGEFVPVAVLFLLHVIASNIGDFIADTAYVDQKKIQAIDTVYRNRY